MGREGEGREFLEIEGDVGLMEMLLTILMNGLVPRPIGITGRLN
jgi:hypothetical protein